MSKRHINKQQSARISKAQERYQQERDIHTSTLLDGLIIARHGKHAELEDEHGQRFHCSLRPNLEIVVAGDKVIWQMEGNKQGVVVSLYPRASLLARPTTTTLQKPIAANITQIIVVVAPKPEISWTLLDSYLIMADLLKLQVIILLNKADLPLLTLQEDLLKHYQPLAHSLMTTSQNNLASILALGKVLDQQVSVLVGQSGVGKSSLITALLPHETNIITGALSVRSEQGTHTTSNSRYYHLPHGGAIIDSPGIRELNLGHIDPGSLASHYTEFRPYLLQCKFRNCTHLNTPHCAIKEAVNHGAISSLRYENYKKLFVQYQNG